MINKKIKILPLLLLLNLLLAEFFLIFNKSPSQNYIYRNFAINLDANKGMQHLYFGNTLNNKYSVHYFSKQKKVQVYVGQPFVYSIKINNNLIGAIFGVGYIRYHSTYMIDREDNYFDVSNYLVNGQNNTIEIDIVIDCYCNANEAYFKINKDGIEIINDVYKLK